MKTQTQLAISSLALAALAWAAAAQATNLAELPLKTSVLAKPNVIFGLDDSGSMDSEVMLYNNDGAFWWNYTNGDGWGIDAAHPNPALRSKTSTWFNNVGSATTTWRKMVYLFPNGTANAGDRIYSDATNDHFAIMPTATFAFLRWSGVWRDSGGALRAAPTDPADSPLHNPIYYNPMVTYQPWAPAQLSSGAVTPVNAVTTAVRSHPVINGTTFDLSAGGGIAANTAGNFVFTALPGMTIPAGARISVCDANNANCGAWSTSGLAADTAAAADAVTRVAMDYFPATYWVKEDCTVAAGVSVASANCVVAPDGSKLRRYEIKSGNIFPSGRSYAAELQNFANWFQYHRKRKLMLAGAMGETMEGLTGMRLGVVRFNSRTTVTMYDADATAAASNRLRVAGFFYENPANGGTPTRDALDFIGREFARTDKTGSAYNVIQYACQRNNAFILTDGFANNSGPSMPDYQSGKSAATWGSGLPYENIPDSSLSDLALRYYTNNPRPAASTDGLVAGRLPATPNDANTDLHMNTYALTMGARGTLFFTESSPVPTTANAWPAPNTNRNPTSVDDLWHATINGRGKMYLANTPEETALRVRAGLDDILSQEGAQSAIGVSSVNLGRGDDYAYLGRYNARGWAGDLTRNAVNNTTGAVSTTAAWSAAALLAARDWTTRLVFTSTDSGGQDFTAAAIGATVNPNPYNAGTNPDGFTNQQVVEYLRGNRAGEGTTLRARSSLIGAVINAEPVVSRTDGVVYLASSEGMLHAFDTATGAELWAYHPAETLAAAGQQVQRGWVFKTLLDATPAFAQLSATSKMVIGGLGAAGRSYYALDVSSPRPATEAAAKALFKWTFPKAGDAANKALMGYTVGKPVIARTAANGQVVLVTSGYDNGLAIGDGKGRVWMLSATDGSVLKTFVTTEGSAGDEAGLAHVSAFRELDGTTKYAYGGDLKGNLWRFDLTKAGAGPHTAELVATFIDASNNRQPVTAAPELSWVGDKRVILVGTGRLLDIGDFGSSRVQSFYAVADGATLANARTGLVAQTYTRGTDTITANTIDWTTQRGWYLDLPAGEQANTDPIITYGAVAFVTNVQGGIDCSQSSWLYLLDIGKGTRVTGSDFVATSIATNANSSRVITLRTVNGKIVGSTHRSDNTVYQRDLPLGVTIPPSKNAWRELRR
jgi:type IV pilus assembly protein PilY1